jgi:hypothetical protein
VVGPVAAFLPLWLTYKSIVAISVDHGGWAKAVCAVLLFVGIAAALAAPAAICAWSRRRRDLPG